MAAFKVLATFIFTVCFILSPVMVMGQSAQSRSSYFLVGSYTFLSDFDVGYFSFPITIYRIKNTSAHHTFQFDVLRYIEKCLSWEKVCVSYDPSGQCTSYQNKCTYVDFDTYPVAKRIDLAMQNLPALSEKEEEIYELEIDRQKPFGGGEDWVTTRLRAIKTKVPVRVRRWGNYSYSIEPKQ